MCDLAGQGLITVWMLNHTLDFDMKRITKQHQQTVKSHKLQNSIQQSFYWNSHQQTLKPQTSNSKSTKLLLEFTQLCSCTIHTIAHVSKSSNTHLCHSQLDCSIARFVRISFPKFSFHFLAEYGKHLFFFFNKPQTIIQFSNQNQQKLTRSKEQEKQLGNEKREET